MDTPSVAPKLTGTRRALVASRYAAQIADLLFRCQQEMDGIYADQTWESVGVMTQRVYRGKAETAVIGLDVLADARALSRMTEWALSKLEYDFRDDFTTFPRELAEAALSIAIPEYEFQLRRAFDEEVGLQASSVREAGKCYACGAVMLRPARTFAPAECPNCGWVK